MLMLPLITSHYSSGQTKGILYSGYRQGQESSDHFTSCQYMSPLPDPTFFHVRHPCDPWLLLIFCLSLTLRNQVEYGKQMIRHRFFFALILLVISLVFSSGAHATVTALFKSGTPPACCDHDSSCPTAPFESSSPAQGCECTSCISFILSPSPSQPDRKGFQTIASFSSFVRFPPPEYVKTIDYPPELS